MKTKKLVALCAAALTVVLGLTACSGFGGGGADDSSQNADTVLGNGRQSLKIISGSENQELEPILEEFSRDSGIRIEMTYQGSLDIMREMEQEEIEYDAVWPASSLWLNVGDTGHKVKHAESVSISPVVFGIRQSLAEELGFVGREVSVRDILDAITAGKLKFCMTSATQSNSGASAYIGFLYALLGNPNMITEEDLESPQLQSDIQALFAGVDRSSGSSDWLKDMFLEGGYDAMVNYECLIIQANEELESRGEETLYVVYPYDGLTLADSPLGYVDHGDDKKEEAFLKLQEYLLSAEVQNEIQRTGRRTGYTGIAEENKDVFRTEWGVQPDRVLSVMKMPSTEVLFEALNLYQTDFKKPSLNIYCLDYSGSMAGEGRNQLVAAMEQLLIQENAEKNFLQASKDEVNVLILFDDRVLAEYTAVGSGGELEALYEKVKEQPTGSGTDMYIAADEALNVLQQYDLSQYTPAVILLTDGMSGGSYDAFMEHYREMGEDVPIFSIMFGDADPEQLDELAAATNARVFDGREDLIDAFRKVKGYN